MAKVSVIIAIYNGATRGYLVLAIESVLSQSYKEIELILVDDGSTDDTKALCEKYLTDSRVTYFYKENGGAAAARNLGIQKSTGELICFLDDDDVWLPEKLEKQINLFNTIKDCSFGMSYTGLHVIDAQGKKTGFVSCHHAGGNIFEKILIENIVDCTSSVMIKRGVLRDIGVFREELSYAEDYELWLRIAKKYSVYSVNEPLVLYREHGNQLSANIDEIEKNGLQAVVGCIKDRDIDQNYILNQIYIRWARYRFWLGHHKKFREYIRASSRYGAVGFDLYARYFVSFFPRGTSVVRRLKSRFF